MKPIRNIAATRGLAISLLVILNAIVLKDGYVNDKGNYLWLFITFPLLLVAVYDVIRNRHARDTDDQNERNNISSIHRQDEAASIGEKIKAL